MIVNVNASTKSIPLGIRAENEATTVVFDCSALAAEYGAGTAVLMNKRRSDAAAYPCTVTQDGSTVSWLLTSTDLRYDGVGACELFWYVGEVLAKSIVYMTYIDRDIGEATGTPPDPYEDWVETLTELGAQILEATPIVTRVAGNPCVVAIDSSGKVARSFKPVIRVKAYRGGVQIPITARSFSGTNLISYGAVPGTPTTDIIIPGLTTDAVYRGDFKQGGTVKDLDDYMTNPPCLTVTADGQQIPVYVSVMYVQDGETPDTSVFYRS